MVSVKKFKISSTLFFSEIGLAIMLSYGVEDDKNVRFVKSQKNGYFPKAVNPWFWSKNAKFLLVSFGVK